MWYSCFESDFNQIDRQQKNEESLELKIGKIDEEWSPTKRHL